MTRQNRPENHTNGAVSDDAAELADAYASGVVVELNAHDRRRPATKTTAAAAPPGPGPESDSDPFADVPDEPGHVLLDDVAGWMAAHVAYASEHHAPTVALWAAHTHALDKAASTPRLAFLSPEPGSGKTRSLELLDSLVCRGRLVLSMTPAALFRVVESERPTILLDEVDAVFGPKASKDHEDLRALINAGHRPGATVMRVVGDGGSMRAKEFSSYCAVALAGLGQLPATIASRAITIPMRRRAPDEAVRDYRERKTRPQGEALRHRLAAWTHRHASEIPEDPELPPGVTDRPADCWEPLIAIADAAGGPWPERARNACQALVAEAATDDRSLGVRLLADIRHAFGNDPRLATGTLIARLIAMDEAPWASKLDAKSDKATGVWLAAKLRPYGISPRPVRIEGVNARGYEATDFADTWRRYLPHQHATHATHATALPAMSRLSRVSRVGDPEPPTVDTAPHETDYPHPFNTESDQ